MCKADDTKLIKEISTTHFYRNKNSPAVLGCYENYNNLYQNKNESNTKNHKISIIMELIKGFSLSEKIQKLTLESIHLPEYELIYLIHLIELAQALEFIHSKNLIHRDIKPQNIMISHDFNLKLIDFGISKSSRHTCTTTKEFGTVRYFPPENVMREMDMTDEDFFKTDDSSAAKRRISTAFDIWSFGLIVSEIFGCESPWGNDRNQNDIIIDLMLKKKFPIPKNLENPKLIYLVENCTKIYPKERIKIKDIIHILFTVFKERLSFISKNRDIRKLFHNKKESNIYCLI